MIIMMTMNSAPKAKGNSSEGISSRNIGNMSDLTYPAAGALYNLAVVHWDILKDCSNKQSLPLSFINLGRVSTNFYG
jgi:hypothetical protein